MPKNKLYIALAVMLFIAVGSGGLIWYINSKRQKEKEQEQEQENPILAAVPIVETPTPPNTAPTLTPTPVVSLPLIRVMDEKEDSLTVLMMYKDTKLVYVVTDKEDLPAHERNGLIFDAMKMPGGFKFFIENQAGRRIGELMVESKLGDPASPADNKKDRMSGVS